MSIEEKGIISPCSILDEKGNIIFQCAKAFTHDVDKDKSVGNGVVPEVACPKLDYRRRLLAKKKAGWGEAYPEDFIMSITRPLYNPILRIKPYKDWQNLITPQHDYYVWVARYSKNAGLQDLKYGLDANGLPDTNLIHCEGPFKWGYTQSDFDKNGYPKVMGIVRVICEEPDSGQKLTGHKDYLDTVMGTAYMEYNEECEVEPRSDFVPKNDTEFKKGDLADRKERIAGALFKFCGATGLLPEFMKNS